MLKVFGHIYANEKNDFEQIADALRREGYQIAYEGEINGSVIKEVSNLTEETENV